MREIDVPLFYKEAVAHKRKIKAVYLSKSTFLGFLGLRIEYLLFNF